MNKEQTASLLIDIVGRGNVKINELMKFHTSFKVGGPADMLVMPENTEHLKRIISICRTNGVDYYVIGNGSNLVVRDKGIRGVVIKLLDNFKNYTVNGDIIEAEAGVLLSTLSNIALQNSLSGLEFASGIPGTLGGAVTMNAGAYGGEMKDIVIKTEFLDSEGTINTIKDKEHGFGYRTSFIQKHEGIVLKSVMKLKKGNMDEIRSTMRDLTNRRIDKQPLNMPSAGSVFKRPEGHFTGKLIEECGLKGCRIGGAEVSCKHCGFIVNAGGATAEDIISLIEHIKNQVLTRFGVSLQTELRIIGDE